MPKIEDMTLEEPQEPEGEKSLEEKLLEIAELEQRAQEEHRTSKEPEYWQGRKDGLRIALAILEPGEHVWKDLIKTSPGFRIEEKEVLLEMLKDARFNIGAALWEYSEKPERNIHIYTIVNLLQWLASYDQRAAAGDLIPTPNAITPDWGLLTRGKRTGK